MAQDSPGAALHDRVLQLSGVWRLAELAELERTLHMLALPADTRIDASALVQIDSAGALLLLRTLQRAGLAEAPWQGLGEVPARIIEDARRHLVPLEEPDRRAARKLLQRPEQLMPLARFGRSAWLALDLLLGHLNFFGALAVALASVLRHPGRLRHRELFVQLQQTGLAAIPVIALVTLLIGIVFAYLLGLQAEQYGASIFVVDGVGIGATREFAPILVAVVVAGRSGAAFTAQLGSMRLTEEVDAIRTLGLAPMQVLVVPRVLALLVCLPLLVFVGDVMSLLGALLIAGPMLDIVPSAFLARLREALDLKHVIVGLAKAPAFALVIAVIGARMGLTVARDTRALGAATTSTVVQSIVAVILVDALAAVLLQAVGW